VSARPDFRFGEVQTRAAMLTPTPMVHAARKHPRKQPRAEDVNRLVDRTLEDSFPASDPPSWTASVARPAPAGEILARARDIGPIRRVLQRAAALF
jgi:hypothetical protein